MKHKFALVLPAVLLVIAGCAGPVVSDFNGSSVKIQTMLTSDEEMASSLAEATRICAKVGKIAEYASSRPMPNYNSEHLYLCL